MSRRISETTVRRLSLYLRILERMEGQGTSTVGSEDLADRAATTAAQVRKDLSLFGSFGKRGLGYDVPKLAAELREILGLDRRWSVALVGAGRIGSALMEYDGFPDRGFDIVAVFDVDESRRGSRWSGATVMDVDRLEEVVRDRNIQMVILAVPGSAAQEVADRAVAAGAQGILNFAPVQLRVPEGVSLKDVNLVMELEALAFALTQPDVEE